MIFMGWLIILGVGRGVVIVSFSSHAFILCVWYVLTMCADTAFISSQGGWLYCDDSVVKSVDPRQVVVSCVLPLKLLRLSYEDYRENLPTCCSTSESKSNSRSNI